MGGSDSEIRTSTTNWNSDQTFRPEGFDDDCSGSLNDEDAFRCTVFFADLDGDGHGGSSACLCASEEPYLFEMGGDCNDDAVLVLSSVAHKRVLCTRHGMT